MKPPDDAKCKVLADWLGRARSDMALALHLVAEGTAFSNAIAFHAQQAAEKYLKAYLVSHDVFFPKTHDIGELLDLVEPVDPALATTLRDLDDLSPYGAELRYPADRPDVTPIEARQATDLARRARDAIEPLLPNVSQGES